MSLFVWILCSSDSNQPSVASMCESRNTKTCKMCESRNIKTCKIVWIFRISLGDTENVAQFGEKVKQRNSRPRLGICTGVSRVTRLVNVALHANCSSSLCNKAISEITCVWERGWKPIPLSSRGKSMNQRVFDYARMKHQ